MKKRTFVLRLALLIAVLAIAVPVSAGTLPPDPELSGTEEPEALRTGCNGIGCWVVAQRAGQLEVRLDEQEVFSGIVGASEAYAFVHEGEGFHLLRASLDGRESAAEVAGSGGPLPEIEYLGNAAELAAGQLVVLKGNRLEGAAWFQPLATTWLSPGGVWGFSYGRVLTDTTYSGSAWEVVGRMRPADAVFGSAEPLELELGRAGSVRQVEILALDHGNAGTRPLQVVLVKDDGSEFVILEDAPHQEPSSATAVVPAWAGGEYQVVVRTADSALVWVNLEVPERKVYLPLVLKGHPEPPPEPGPCEGRSLIMTAQGVTTTTPFGPNPGPVNRTAPLPKGETYYFRMSDGLPAGGSHLHLIFSSRWTGYGPWVFPTPEPSHSWNHLTGEFTVWYWEDATTLCVTTVGLSWIDYPSAALGASEITPVDPRIWRGSGLTR